MDNPSIKVCMDKILMNLRQNPRFFLLNFYNERYMLTEHVKIHLGWSQNELARRMGISPQKLSYQVRNETFELERINKVLVEHGAPEYDPRWETDRTERMTKLDLVNENSELRQKLTQCEARVDKLLEIISNK